MKKMLAVVLLAGLALSSIAGAEEKLKIGYVDVRQVLIESSAGKQFQAAAEKEGKEKQSMFEAEGKKLQALKAAYEKDQLTYSEKQKQTKQRELQEKVQALNSSVNETQEEFRQKEGAFTSKTVKDIRAIIADVAKAQKVTLVLEKSEMSVLYAEDGMDMTAEVLKQFNAKFPAK